MKRFPLLFMLIACNTILAGCSSSPTVGGKMLAQSQDTKELGEQWNSGNKLVSSGKRKVEEGEKLIAQGNKLVSQGNSEMRRGETMILESERVFNERFPQGLIQN